MSRLPGLRRIFRLTETSSSVDRDVDDELEFHLAMRTEALIARGMAPAEARDAARREFGDLRTARAELSAIDRRRLERARWGDWWRSLRQDLHFAARTLAKQRDFTAAAVLTLGLGIGATSATLSVVNGVVLRPLPYPNHDRLALLWTTAVTENTPRNELPFSAANFLDARERLHSFERIAAFRSWGYSLVEGGAAELIPSAQVSAGLFEVLGVEPLVGRTLAPEDDRPGAPKVAVIGYDLWRRRFGGDRHIVDRQITLNGERYTVIGVMPPGFQFPRGAELPSELQFAPRTALWAPLAFTPEAARNRGTLNLAVVGVLKPGVTFERARREAADVMRRIGEETGWDKISLAGTVVPMHEQSVRAVRAGLLLLLGAVALVLLIGCANVSNLLLARTAARQRELAIRTALGASRGRVVRQLITENVLLATAGAAVGIGLAAWGKRALLTSLPSTLPRVDDVVIDARVVGVTLLVTFLAGSVFGLVAALHAGDSDVAATLREGGRAGGGVGRSRLRHALIMGEVALSLVLLVGAALLLESFVRMQRVEPGFRPAGAITATMVIPQRGGASLAEEAPRWRVIMQRYFERVRTIPGVQAAGAVSTLPLTGAWESTSISIEGRPKPAAGQGPVVQYAIATPGYTRAMGIPLRRGRVFDEHDDANAPHVVLITEAAAERYWPGQDPIGQRIRVFSDTLKEIVGVVGDVRQTTLTDSIQPTIYIPYAQFPIPEMSLVVRAERDPISLVPALRSELRAVDPNAPLSRIRSLRSVFDESLAQRRFSMLLVGSFAASALLLAAVGLFGVIAYAVGQRTHEIGVRIALGAQRHDVLRLILRQGMVLTAIGLAIGVVGALAVTRLIRRQLFEVSPTNPLTYAAIAALLLGTALVASYVPARRATRIDPVGALRQE